MANNCEAVNKAGHQCVWPIGHSRHGFVGIGGSAPDMPVVPVHGYYNSALCIWEVWPVATTPPKPPPKG